MNEFSLNLFWSKRATIAKFVGSFILLSLVVSAVTPIRYESTAQLLVVHRGIFGQDPYVASRSTEYLSQVLAEVVNSRSFIETVRQTDPNVLLDLPTEPNEQKRIWNKLVQPHVVRDTGILKLSAYDRNHDQAGELANAVVQTLIAHGADYHGQGDAVSIRVIESPITTRWPAKPNVLGNLLVALVAGFLAAFGALYLWPEGIVTLSQSKGAHPHHKKLFDWHVPGDVILSQVEGAEAALERIHPEEQQLDVIASEAKQSHPSAQNIPTVFEHMAGRLQ